MRTRHIGLIATLCFVAGAYGPIVTARADQSLYEAFGGTEGFNRLAAGMLALTTRDPRTAAQFDNINLDWLRPRLAAFLCMSAGGPCHYPGRDMYSAHIGLHISVREFNAVVEDLQIAMNRQGIPFAAQNRFLALLAPMEREIVTR